MELLTWDDVWDLKGSWGSHARQTGRGSAGMRRGSLIGPLVGLFLKISSRKVSYIILPSRYHSLT